uniref:(northern house mosquito) hypothetical protein n=1 Tax=Culex pipiens TaxID=7175 RepID=A0A8D8E2H4_CULPI
MRELSGQFGVDLLAEAHLLAQRERFGHERKYAVAILRFFEQGVQFLDKYFQPRMVHRNAPFACGVPFGRLGHGVAHPVLDVTGVAALFFAVALPEPVRLGWPIRIVALQLGIRLDDDLGELDLVVNLDGHALADLRTHHVVANRAADQILVVFLQRNLIAHLAQDVLTRGAILQNLTDDVGSNVEIFDESSLAGRALLPRRIEHTNVLQQNSRLTSHRLLVLINVHRNGTSVDHVHFLRPTRIGTLDLYRRCVLLRVLVISQEFLFVRNMLLGGFQLLLEGPRNLNRTRNLTRFCLKTGSLRHDLPSLGQRQSVHLQQFALRRLVPQTKHKLIPQRLLQVLPKVTSLGQLPQRPQKLFGRLKRPRIALLPAHKLEHRLNLRRVRTVVILQQLHNLVESPRQRLGRGQRVRHDVVRFRSHVVQQDGQPARVRNVKQLEGHFQPVHPAGPLHFGRVERFDVERGLQRSVRRLGPARGHTRVLIVGSGVVRVFQLRQKGHLSRSFWRRNSPLENLD